jgi:hypothetical protein
MRIGERQRQRKRVRERMRDRWIETKRRKNGKRGYGLRQWFI